MTVTMLLPLGIDAHLAEVKSRRERASSLRSRAEQLDPVLAMAYRRRASELELEAFLVETLTTGAGAPAA